MRISFRHLVLPAAVLIVGGFAVTASASGVSQGSIPAIVPSTATPDVANGQVETIIRIGNKVIIGGTFTQAANHGTTTNVARANILAFDAATGLIDNAFAPAVNGEVMALEVGPTANTVYIAGKFNTVNGVNRRKVALLNTTNGSLVTGFNVTPAPNSAVSDIARVGSRLYLGGIFATVGNVAHAGLASVNATTGALDPYMNIQMAGHHNYDGVTGAQAGVGTQRFDVSPDGSRLAVVGNFKTVNGTDHDQAVLIDLNTPINASIANWQTNRFDDACARNAFDSWVRDVAFSTDGSYFVIVGTGAGFAGTLCDSASRWETNATGTLLRETWADFTGGDTLLSVAITGPAIYVGGHQRWMNNSLGRDRARPGAVGRAGIAALDPLSGLPLTWNPGRNSRGNGAAALYATADGLYVGSDTDYIGNFQYFRGKVAFLPLAGGYAPIPTNVADLPGNVYFPKSGVAQSPVLYRINVGGPAVAASDAGPNWADDTAATSPYRVVGGGATVVNFANNITKTDPALPAGTPLALFNSQRRDQAAAPDMQWNFPVLAGTHTTVRLYFAERQWPQPAVGARVFNVSIDSTLVADHLDITAANTWGTATVRQYPATSDGNIDIDFTAVAGLPMLSAIEILNLDSGGTLLGLGKRSFNGTTAGADLDAGAADGTAWASVRGAFWVGGQMFYASTDGNTYKRSFNGTAFGPQVLVNPHSDPYWDPITTGSGTSTYAGVKGTFFTEIPTVTSMWYSAGRLFYTQTGQTSLFWRWFTPDSGTIGAEKFTVTGSTGFDTVSGVLFGAGGKLYFAKTDGNLYSVNWVNNAPSGAATVVNGPGTGGIDWHTNFAFLAP